MGPLTFLLIHKTRGLSVYGLLGLTEHLWCTMHGTSVMNVLLFNSFVLSEVCYP